ncbi:carbohydrate esterase family 16 [Fusarium heterosporum]|uniref:Carbohydrate esterase family 16 n=1 Tax=Fusarium heterosporum TaxID=42747 RepID=A0A8H5WHT2_FUSHE|nr:carbohydrate esterase family 16 [Fusarium heterosporum]
MLFNLSLLVALLAAAGEAAAVTASTPSVNHWKGFSKLKTVFVFGDSYSRTGFNPKGTQPNSKNKIGNPAFPGITSSNGPNWVGYLTSAFNQSPFLTYNFGTSGAVIGTPNSSSNRYTVVREIDEKFTPNYKLGKTFVTDSSLFAIWIGINDVIINYQNRNSNTYDASFKSYRAQVEKLYKAGARNFLLLTVPPLQLTPRVSKSSNHAKNAPLVTAAVADWNRRVKALQKEFGRLHPSATVFLYDTYPLFQKVYENPLQFHETSGYKDTKGYCSKYEKWTITKTRYQAAWM